MENQLDVCAGQKLLLNRKLLKYAPSALSTSGMIFHIKFYNRNLGFLSVHPKGDLAH